MSRGDYRRKREIFVRREIRQQGVEEVSIGFLAAEGFSPNALFRPVRQDYLWPTGVVIMAALPRALISPNSTGDSSEASGSHAGSPAGEDYTLAIPKLSASCRNII